MFRPTYKVQVGSTSIEPKTSDDIIDMAVRLSIDSAPGHFEAVIAIGEKGSGSKEDTVTVALGYEKNGSKNLTTVFTGKIESINTMGSKVMVLSPLTKLYSLRVDRFYDHQTAGAIVTDLANEAGVTVGTVSDGFTFPSYVVSKSKTAYEHIIELAQICDFDFYGTNEAKLVFKEHQENAVHSLRYGANIINIQKMDQIPPVDSVKVSGSSPSDSKGSDTHYWMTKKNVEDSAGSGGNQLLLQNMALKDKATAKKVAEAALKRLRSVIYLKVLVFGNEKVMLGDTVEIRDVPEQSLNGKFEIREIEHFFTKAEGFTTAMICRGAPVT